MSDLRILKFKFWKPEGLKKETLNFSPRNGYISESGMALEILCGGVHVQLLCSYFKDGPMEPLPYKVGPDQMVLTHER